jgi:hypothetical protein
MLILMVALDPLPHLYTIYSDNIESNSELEDNLSVAVLNNTIGQGESDFSKSVSFSLTTRVYIFKDEANTVTINPDTSSPPPGLGSDMIDAPTSPSGIPERHPADLDHMIESDSSSLHSLAMGNESPHFKSSDSNIFYKFHSTINGDDLSLYTNIPLTNPID